MTANHLDTFGTPKPLSSDLILAIISVGLIFIAKPLLAQSSLQSPQTGSEFGAGFQKYSGQTTTAQPVTGQNSAVPTNTGAVPTSPAMESTASPRSYVNPIIAPVPDAITPGSSQSQRAANSNQNGTNSQVQPMPECRVDDSVCIEARNKRNSVNPDTAPAFIR